MKRSMTAKQKKKLAISVLCAVTFGLLSGCGNAQNNAVGSTVQDKHKQVVEYFNNYDIEYLAFTDCVSKYADVLKSILNSGSLENADKLTVVANQMGDVVNQLKNMSVPPKSDIEKFQMDTITMMQSEKDTSGEFASRVQNGDFSSDPSLDNETNSFSSEVKKLGDEEIKLKKEYNYYG